MKRVYQKPTLEVESFVLTQAITSCSGTKIGFSDAQCVLADPDASWQMKTFAKEDNWFIDGCLTMPIDGTSNDGICYHTSTNMAFTS